jgi:hypothetical protein
MLQTLRRSIGKAMIEAGVRKNPRRVVGMPEATREERALIDRFAPYTMNPALLQWTLLKALHHVQRRGIPGAIVECGVWRGGNMLLAAEVLRDRDVYLYDTFAGMTAPTEFDVKPNGIAAAAKFEANQREGYNEWCYASLDEVRSNFKRFGLLSERIHFVKGPVEETLRGHDLPDKIAVLRLDTDWYASVKVSLEALYPLLSPGGVIVFDDYGAWNGARKAVDEYFTDENAPLLIPVEPVCRMAIKA